jgi:hypothetical protein
MMKKLILLAAICFYLASVAQNKIVLHAEKIKDTISKTFMVILLSTWAMVFMAGFT